VTELDPRSEEQEEIPIEELFPEEMSQSSEEDNLPSDGEQFEPNQVMDSDVDLEEENHRVV
jgi:methylthioribose-1-phosphate isomerase